MSAHMPVTPPQARPGIYLASYPVRCPVKQRTGRVFAGCSGHRDGQPLDHWHQGSDWPTLAAKKWTQPDRSFSCHMIACNPEHAEAKPSSKRTTAVTSLDRFGEKAPHQVSFFFSERRVFRCSRWLGVRLSKEPQQPQNPYAWDFLVLTPYIFI